MRPIRTNVAWMAISCFLYFTQAFPVYGAGDTLSLEQAVEESIAANPGLASIQARAEALADISTQKGVLPDPTLTAKIANLPTDTFSNTQEPMTQMIVGLSQKFPFPGKLPLKQQAAKYEGQAAGAEVAEKRLQLIQNVKTVWWNLFYLDRALETVARNQELMHQFINIAQTKYKVGKGLQQDVLLAQLELSKLFDLELAFINSRRNGQSKLNALLDRPARQEIKLPATVAKNLSPVATLETLHNRARKSRPLLDRQQKRLDATLARVALAKKAYYPDFMVGASYGYRDGENPNGSSRADFASLSVSINLPLFTAKRQDSALSQRHNERTQRELALKNSDRQVEAAIVRALDDYSRFTAEVALYEKGIIPQAKQTVQSMQAGYQVNKVDFLNLIKAQTSLYNYETKYWRALSSAKQALVRLVTSVGEENIYE